MYFVDTLRIKLLQLSRRKLYSPLASARARFGSLRDFEAIAKLCAAAPPESEVVIDLTPFERIGPSTRVRDTLGNLALSRGLTFLAYEGGVQTTLETSGVLNDAGLIVFDAGGQPRTPISRGYVSIKRARAFSEVSRVSLEDTHRAIARGRLLDMLADNVVYAQDVPPDHRDLVGGREYLRLDNGMLVSCYVNTKHLFSDPIRLFDTAFEVTRALHRSFRRDSTEMPPFDLLVAPSNASLAVASAVNALTHIQLCVIDRIGPIPSYHLGAINSSLELRGRRVALVVEVSSTGSEIDRTLQYLDYRRAQIERIVCCYAWNAARPHLSEEGAIINLCEPKRELGYVYRSA